MTEGISKEELLGINPWEYCTHRDLLEAIISRCRELDPWLEINERAKESNKPLLVRNGDDIDLCVWRDDLQIWYPSYFEPTHYKEVTTSNAANRKS